MQQFEVRVASRIVRATRNGAGRPWTSRLYVNGGETATLVAASHKTEAGVRKWAAQILTGERI